MKVKLVANGRAPKRITFDCSMYEGLMIINALCEYVKIAHPNDKPSVKQMIKDFKKGAEQ